MVFCGIASTDSVDALEVCIRIETARAHLYYELLRLFCEPPQVRVLWWNLCEEGYRHTAALAFIKREVELEPEVSKLEFLGWDQDRLYQLLRLVERFERRVNSGRLSLDDAFKMALKLRACGVEGLLGRVLSSVDPMICEMVVRTLRPPQYSFRDLVRTIESCTTDEGLRERARGLMP